MDALLASLRALPSTGQLLQRPAPLRHSGHVFVKVDDRFVSLAVAALQKEFPDRTVLPSASTLGAHISVVKHDEWEHVLLQRAVREQRAVERAKRLHDRAHPTPVAPVPQVVSPAPALPKPRGGGGFLSRLLPFGRRDSPPPSPPGAARAVAPAKPKEPKRLPRALERDHGRSGRWVPDADQTDRMAECVQQLQLKLMALWTVGVPLICGASDSADTRYTTELCELIAAYAYGPQFTCDGHWPHGLDFSPTVPFGLDAGARIRSSTFCSEYARFWYVDVACPDLNRFRNQCLELSAKPASRGVFGYRITLAVEPLKPAPAPAAGPAAALVLHARPANADPNPKPSVQGLVPAPPGPKLPLNNYFFTPLDVPTHVSYTPARPLQPAAGAGAAASSWWTGARAVAPASVPGLPAGWSNGVGIVGGTSKTFELAVERKDLPVGSGLPDVAVRLTVPREDTAARAAAVADGKAPPPDPFGTITRRVHVSSVPGFDRFSPAPVASRANPKRVGSDSDSDDDSALVPALTQEQVNGAELVCTLTGYIRTDMPLPATVAGGEGDCFVGLWLRLDGSHKPTAHVPLFFDNQSGIGRDIVGRTPWTLYRIECRVPWRSQVPVPAGQPIPPPAQAIAQTIEHLNWGVVFGGHAGSCWAWRLHLDARFVIPPPKGAPAAAAEPARVSRRHIRRFRDWTIDVHRLIGDPLAAEKPALREAHRKAMEARWQAREQRRAARHGVTSSLPDTAAPAAAAAPVAAPATAVATAPVAPLPPSFSPPRSPRAAPPPRYERFWEKPMFGRYRERLRERKAGKPAAAAEAPKLMPLGSQRHGDTSSSEWDDSWGVDTSEEFSPERSDDGSPLHHPRGFRRGGPWSPPGSDLDSGTGSDSDDGKAPANAPDSPQNWRRSRATDASTRAKERAFRLRANQIARRHRNARAKQHPAAGAGAAAPAVASDSAKATAAPGQKPTKARRTHQLSGAQRRERSASM